MVFGLMLLAVSMATAQEWQTDFAKAKELALKKERPIVLVFQGSDWCTPCIKLDKEVWSTEAFRAYAAEHYVLLKADFPRKKGNALPEAQIEANIELAKKYNKQGHFPLVVVLDSSGNVLGMSSYRKTTPESYIEELNAFIK